jgi:hypothetical protein
MHGPHRVADVIGLQSAEPRQNPNEPLEDRYRVKAQGAHLQQSKNKSQYWRPRAQPDDRTWQAQVRRHRLKSVSSRARSALKLICATLPSMSQKAFGGCSSAVSLFLAHAADDLSDLCQLDGQRVRGSPYHTDCALGCWIGEPDD